MAQHQSQFKFDHEYEDNYTLDSAGHIDMRLRHQKSAHTHMSAPARTMPQPGDEFNFPPGAFDHFPSVLGCERDIAMMQQQSNAFNEMSARGLSISQGQQYDDLLGFGGDGTYFPQQPPQQQQYSAYPQQGCSGYSGDPQHPQREKQHQLVATQKQMFGTYLGGPRLPQLGPHNQLPATQQQYPTGSFGYPYASQCLFHRDGKPFFAALLPPTGFSFYGRHQNNNIYSTFSQQQHMYVAPRQLQQPRGYISHTDPRVAQFSPLAQAPSLASASAPSTYTEENPGGPQVSELPVRPKVASANPRPAMKTSGGTTVPQRAKVDQVELKAPGTWAGGKVASKGPSEPQSRKRRKLSPAGTLPTKVKSPPRSPERASQTEEAKQESHSTDAQADEQFNSTHLQQSQECPCVGNVVEILPQPPVVDVASCIVDTPGGDIDLNTEYMTFDFPPAFLGSSHFDYAILMPDLDPFAKYGKTMPATSICPSSAAEEPAESEQVSFTQDFASFQKLGDVEYDQMTDFIVPLVNEIVEDMEEFEQAEDERKEKRELTREEDEELSGNGGIGEYLDG